MKPIALLLVSVAVVTAAVVFTARASRTAAQEAAPIFVTEIPRGYREWRLVSVAHEEGDLNDIRAISATMKLSTLIAQESFHSRKAPSSRE